MTLDEQMAFFFAPPDPEQRGASRSTLHLVRREAQDCLIGKVVQEQMVVAEALKEPHRLFATTMGLMAGLDLLAKLYDGSDEQGRVGQRIRAFAERFIFAGMPSAKLFADVLYVGCRNPMLHSFTLHNHRYRITLTSGVSRGVVHTVRDHPDLFVISIEGLYAAFLEAIEGYAAELRMSDDLKVRFAKMFSKYGSIEFQSYVLQPVRPG